MMDILLAELDGPHRLAIMHCPKDRRDSFAALLVLDRRLAAVVRKTSEPIIAQMRFAWWRDRLSDDPAKWPKGEPFFAALSALGDGEQVRGIADQLQQLVDSWEVLAVSEEWPHDVTSSFHNARAGFIFGELAASSPTISQAGELWSKLDLACQFPERAGVDPSLAPASERLPRQLRALTILQRSAILEWQSRNGIGRGAIMSSVRLMWSSLTGR